VGAVGGGGAGGAGWAVTEAPVLDLPESLARPARGGPGWPGAAAPWPGAGGAGCAP
jgi:hypothetical protein